MRGEEMHRTFFDDDQAIAYGYMPNNGLIFFQ